MFDSVDRAVTANQFQRVVDRRAHRPTAQRNPKRLSHPAKLEIVRLAELRKFRFDRRRRPRFQRFKATYHIAQDAVTRAIVLFQNLADGFLVIRNRRIIHEGEPDLRNHIGERAETLAQLEHPPKRRLRQIGQWRVIDLQIINKAFQQTIFAHPSRPVRVKRQQLGAVELGVALADPLDGESLGRLFERDLFGVVTGGPTQQRNEIQQCLGQVPGRAEVVHVDLRRDLALLDGLFLVALAHLRPAHVEDDGQMGVVRRVETQRTLNRDVLGRVHQVFLAAKHVGDFHEGVIDHAGQVIGRPTVALLNDKVFKLVSRQRHLTENVIHDGDIRIAHLQPHNHRTPFVAGGLCLFGRGQRIGTAVFVVGLVCTGLLAHGGQLFGRLQSVIGVPRIDQPLDMLLINRQPLTLAVGPEVALARIPGSTRSIGRTGCI